MNNVFAFHVYLEVYIFITLFVYTNTFWNSLTIYQIQQRWKGNECIM